MLLIALWFQFGVLGLCICSIIFEDTDPLLPRDIWFVLLGPIIFAGAIVLPNTGSNRTLAIAATLSIIVGVLVLATTAVRFIAKKAYDSKH